MSEKKKKIHYEEHETTITLFYRTTVGLYQLAPKYIKEETLQTRAECDRGRAKGGLSASLGLTRTPASGTNGLQQ